MNEMNSITFYRSFFEAIKKLNDDQRLKLYDAIFEYQFEQKNIEFDDAILQSFWILIRPNIDASNSKKLAGAKGGRPKKSKQKASFSKNKNLAFQKSKSKEEGEGEVEEEEEVDVDVENIASPTTTNVFGFYMNNINPMPTTHEIEQLKDYQKDMADDLICYAIEIAVENKKRNLAYVKGILNSWNGKGITTLAEAKEEKKNFEGGTTDKEQEEIYKRFLAKGDG